MGQDMSCCLGARYSNVGDYTDIDQTVDKIEETRDLDEEEGDGLGTLRSDQKNTVRRWKKAITAVDASLRLASSSGSGLQPPGEVGGVERVGEEAALEANKYAFSVAPEELSPDTLSDESADMAGSQTATQDVSEKRRAHEDKVIEIFNRVMLTDGLKVRKHYKTRSSNKASSRILKFEPSSSGGALTWEKPVHKASSKPSSVPLAFVSEVELEHAIVWLVAGNERVGFETNKVSDAECMYEAICILVDRCNGA